MFEVKLDKPMWELVYDKLATLSINQVASWNELSELLGGAERSTISGTVFKASSKLQETHKRTVTSVRNVGYRIVEPKEHEKLAKHHNLKAIHQTTRAYGKISSTDHSMLSPEDQVRFKNMEYNLSENTRILKGVSKRLDKHERIIAETRRDLDNNSADTNERLSAIELALKQHGFDTTI